MEYRREEIVDKIRKIEDAISVLFNAPTSATVNRLTSSFAGRYEELRRERAFWLARLDEWDAASSGYSAAQGPDKRNY